MRRIGVLMNVAADPQGQARIAAFQEVLQQSGGSDGRNVRIDVLWGENDIEREWARSPRRSGWPQPCGDRAQYSCFQGRSSALAAWDIPLSGDAAVALRGGRFQPLAVWRISPTIQDRGSSISQRRRVGYERRVRQGCAKSKATQTEGAKHGNHE